MIETKRCKLGGLLVLLALCSTANMRGKELPYFSENYVKSAVLSKINLPNDVGLSLRTAGQESPAASCWRNCIGYPNTVRVSGQSIAGLRDRQSVLNTLAGLAGYLCARLVVLPPHGMLAPKHNHFKRINNNLVWADFWNITFASDQTSVLLSESDFNLRVTNSYPTLQLKSNKTQMTHHFERLRNFTKQQMNSVQTPHGVANNPGFNVSFLWNITDLMYDWRELLAARFKEIGDQQLSNLLPLVSANSEICGYANFEHSSYIRQAKESVWSSIRNDTVIAQGSVDKQTKQAAIGHLHIRRGDSKKSCDTSVENMFRFLNCSLSGMPPVGTIVLLSSDEGDECYRMALLRYLREGIGIGSFDLDQIIKDVVESTMAPRFHNNMIVFAVSESIRLDRQLTSFHLLKERRAGFCQNCTPVAGERAELSGLSSVLKEENRKKYHELLEAYYECRSI